MNVRIQVRGMSALIRVAATAIVATATGIVGILQAKGALEEHNRQVSSHAVDGMFDGSGCYGNLRLERGCESAHTHTTTRIEPMLVPIKKMQTAVVGSRGLSVVAGVIW